MKNVIKMGEGKIEVAQGIQDGVPVLVLAPQKEAHSVGMSAKEMGSQISDADLDKRNAVVIEFPNYKGLDVVMYELMGLWQRSKDAKWD